MKNEKVWKIAMTGVFAALSYVVFTFLQFKIWLPGGDATSIHFGNAVCVLGALILGGVYGGIGGAIGMTIGDLLDPVYVVYAPKTFILKFCIGLIAGLIAHKIGKINEQTDQKQIFKWALLAAIGGLLFNVIFDPLIGYFYKLVLLGKPAAEVTLSWNVAATSINAVLSTIASVVIYMALRPALQKSGLFSQVKAAAKYKFHLRDIQKSHHVLFRTGDFFHAFLFIFQRWLLPLFLPHLPEWMCSAGI